MVSGCARNSVVVPGDPIAALKAGPPVALAQVLPLERSGVSPDDTVVTIQRSAGRTVMIRHRAPDNSIFAVVRIPGDSAAGGTTTLTVRSIPGRYGVDVETTSPLPAGTTISFSYAVHFQAPSEALTRYGTAVRFEQALAIGRVEGERFRYLSNDRPAADMLSGPLEMPGRYLIAGPAR